MSRYKPIDYQGPARSFTPPVAGYSSSPVPNTFSPQNYKGYADIDVLNDALTSLSNKMNAIYNEAGRQLQNFALVINQEDTTLLAAQQLVYPEDETPYIISYDEYRYAKNRLSTNAAQHIITSYENSLRNPPGTNALDISNLALITYDEVKRIKGFLDEYTGAIDDTAEYRTLELFQDWATDASNISEKLWQALTGEIGLELPKSELDQLTEKTAGQFQAVLQVKLNVINKNIQNTFGQLFKNWNDPSSAFYNRELGPSLGFQIKVGSSINQTINPDTMPVIANEVAATMTKLDSSFKVALADQIKRNRMYINLVDTILANIIQRDIYFRYISQTAFKGKSLNSPFTSSVNLDQSSLLLNSADESFEDDHESPDPSVNFDPAHAELTGTADDDAHPQYLLKSGGIITGDIEFAAGVKVAGMDLALHRHDGIDSVKIRGSDIDENSISEVNIDTTNASTSIPENIQLTSQSSTFVPPGLTKITAKVSFDMEVSSNVVGYEFEITKL